MEQILQTIQTITIIIFMVGNLLEVGLRLKVAEAVAALRNARFLVLSLLWCFVLGPALAVLFTKIIPLPAPYAIGLVLLGMAPCSPAIPVMMRKSGGSLAYMSAFMLIAYAGTVVLMPFMVPWLVKGFTADPWIIAKPLLFFIATPLIIGVAIRSAAETFAEKAAPIVKTVTSVNTIILCLVLLWVYRSEIFSAVGTYAIGSQILLYAVLGFGSYLLGFGLSYEQKAPMVLGICTRNVGPALATLLGVASAPQGAITMCILAIFLGAILSGFAAAALLKRFCAPSLESVAAEPARLAGSTWSTPQGFTGRRT
ncbi:MAG TPA: bile acid:sodium symporter [Anaerolineales bacterium]|nr:bile acid:sodium symporter [Anaerolineales bacterium]